MKKKRLKLPRLSWERKPQTQVQPNGKAYRRKGRKNRQEDDPTCFFSENFPQLKYPNEVSKFFLPSITKTP